MSKFQSLMINKINDDYRWGWLETLYDNYKPTEEIKIPKKIHQIWLGTLPPEYEYYITKIKNLHPEWEYKLWTDDNLNEISLVNQELFNNTHNLAGKSDILRYEILEQFGGIYLDLDFDCIKPFDDLLSLDFFLGYGHSQEICIFNSIIASSPHNELIKLIVASLGNQQGVNKDDINGVMNNTGPYFLSKLLYNYLDQKDLSTLNLVIFPTVYFYPFPAIYRHNVRRQERELEKFIYSFNKPETYCLHLWHTAWQ